MIVIGILLPVLLNCSNSFGCCSIKASSFSAPFSVVNSHNPKASPLMISSASWCCSSDFQELDQFVLKVAILELTVTADVHVADEEILSWHDAYLLTHLL